jgi:hypothetical protein
VELEKDEGREVEGNEEEQEEEEKGEGVEEGRRRRTRRTRRARRTRMRRGRVVGRGVRKNGGLRNQDGPAGAADMLAQ